MIRAVCVRVARGLRIDGPIPGKGGTHFSNGRRDEFAARDEDNAPHPYDITPFATAEVRVHKNNEGRWGRQIRAGGALAVIGALATCLCIDGSRAEGQAAFEIPPEQPAATLLPAELVSGTNYHVVDPVHSDGLMHHYVLDSRFGRFESYGRPALAIRVHEVGALTELAKTSSVDVVAGQVAGGVASQVQTVVGVATHPIQTVTGIPRGIGHLFHGYSDQASEAVADSKRSEDSSKAGGGTAKRVADKGGSAAKRYADRYFGMSAAERRWYQKLGVDPSTDNTALREAIHKAAKVDATASFGMRFVGLPSIPGVGLMSRTTDAIYNEDPATIRARTRTTLAGYGLDAKEIDRWQNTLVLSPTRQVVLLAAAEALPGVAGRAELFRHALGLKAEEETQVYLQSVGLLVLAHRASPVATILPGLRLPAAQRADGRVVVCGAFESVYWTEDVAKHETLLRQALPSTGVTGRELWLSGTASERARTELRALGWDVHESQSQPAAATASR